MTVEAMWPRGPGNLAGGLGEVMNNQGRTPMQEQELRDLYQQFMDRNVRAFAGRHFEVAYHALAAALHCAHEVQDGELISAVQKTAAEQGRWIDSNAPGHRLSSRSARTRSGNSIFVSLTGEAKAMLLGLKVDEQAQRLRQLNENAGAGGPTS